MEQDERANRGEHMDRNERMDRDEQRPEDKRRNAIRTGAAVIAISVLLTCLTLIVPCSVADSDGMGDLRFGLPFAFVRQASTLTPPADSFPRYAGFESPWETPTGLRPFPFLVDVIVISQIVTAVRNALRYRKGQAERETGQSAAVRIHNRRYRRR